MFDNAISFAIRIFVAPLGWFLTMLNSTGALGYFLFIFFLITAYRLLIVPLIGEEAGSDKAKKKEKED